MKTLKLLLLLFSIGILGAYAEDTDISNVDNTLYIENVTVEKGKQVTLSLKMKNNLSITGFQCNLYFPEGVTVQKDEDDYPLIELSTKRTTARNTNIFEAVEQADGSMMILANSTKSKSFTGTDGEVATITLKISSDISSGAHTASIKGIALSDVTGVSHETADVNFTITVKADEEPVEITANNYTINYGDDLPDFGYTSTGAELKGVPAISCEATSSSPVGTYDIVVSKGTVENTIVTFVKGTLTIGKAPLTITAKSYTRKQGEANPTFEVEYEGFKNSETESVLTKKPTVTCSATASSAPGEYDIIPSGASATNYEISYVNGKLTVTSADPVTITAKSYTIEYGEAIPKFEYSSEGAALTGTPEITCSATATSPVGTYDIIVKKGSVTNYNVTYVKGTLTIEKAPLTISGGTYTMKQGDALPTLKAEYSGFKNGETEAVLTKKPTLTTTATSSSAPGEYEVKVSGAEAKNYEISYKAGKITVIKSDAAFISKLERIKEWCQKSREMLEKYKMRFFDIEEYEIGSKGEVWGYYNDGVVSISALESIISRCEEKISKGEEITQQDKDDLDAEYDLISGKYDVTYISSMMGYLCSITITCNGGGQIRTWIDGAGMVPSEYGKTIIRNETKTLYWLYPKFGQSYSGARPGGFLELIVEPDEGYVAMVDGKQVPDNTHLGGEGSCEVTFVKSTENEITLTVNNYTREYGESNPSFDYTVSGGTLNGTPQISCIATETSSVGNYAIKIEKGSVTNSNVTFVDGIMTITKAPLTISGGTYTMKQGDALPELKAEYSGFKNGETEAVLTKKPIFMTTANSTSAPGEYEVKISGAEAQNYEISYKPGKITVTQTDGIETVLLDGESSNIYNLQGKIVRKNANDFIGLPKGVYIVNGRKVIVK